MWFCDLKKRAVEQNIDFLLHIDTGSGMIWVADDTMDDEAREAAKEKGIHFEFKVLSNLPKTVYGDKRFLKQILINLLSNAVKFTNHGKVWLNVHNDVKGFIFEVGDTGCGIKEGDFNKIFEPFRQLNHNSIQHLIHCQRIQQQV